MEFREGCWPRKLRFLQTFKNNICSFLILPKMQKISKKLTTFVDHRRKRQSLWLKKFKKKNIGNIISEKEFGVSLRLKFRSLCLKTKKETQALRQEKRVSLIYCERVSGMPLRVPVETQQVRKVDLNWTCLFVHMGMEWYVCEPLRFLVHFSVPSEF